MLVSKIKAIRNGRVIVKDAVYTNGYIIKPSPESQTWVVLKDGDVVKRFNDYESAYKFAMGTKDSKTKDDTPSEEAYDRGYAAAKSGLLSSANPYSDVSRSGYGDLKSSWEEGWKEGNTTNDSKDEAIDPTKPKNIAAAKSLSVAQGKAATGDSDGKQQVFSLLEKWWNAPSVGFHEKWANKGVLVDRLVGQIPGLTRKEATEFHEEWARGKGKAATGDKKTKDVDYNSKLLELKGKLMEQRTGGATAIEVRNTLEEIKEVENMIKNQTGDSKVTPSEEQAIINKFKRILELGADEYQKGREKIKAQYGLSDNKLFEITGKYGRNKDTDRKTKDAKSATINVQGNDWEVVIMDGTHLKMRLVGTSNWSTPMHIAQVSPDFMGALRAGGLVSGNFFVEDSFTGIDSIKAELKEAEADLERAKAKGDANWIREASGYVNELKKELASWGKNNDSKTKDAGNWSGELSDISHDLFRLANKLSMIAGSSTASPEIKDVCKKSENLLDEARHLIFKVR